jgi:nucleotide-binding universal stress UspA family protein
MRMSDLFVVLDPELEAAGHYALWLSKELEAGLTAASAVLEPSLAYISAELPSEILSKIQEEAEHTANIVLTDFADQGRQRGVSVETQLVRALAGEAGREIRKIARYYDVTIIGQDNPENARSGELIESALFGSGRPILVVPYIFEEPGKLEMVLVAWDGSQAAARALGDSLPLLAQAKRVRVVTVEGVREPANDHWRKEVVRHLKRHGIEAEADTLVSAGDTANTLLSHAADSGADLIVMGGYGHSRIREIVLGGVTREILRSMTIPVLMSH